MRKCSPVTVAAESMIQQPISSKRRHVTGVVNTDTSPLRVKPQVRPLLTRERGQVTDHILEKKGGGTKWLETDGNDRDTLPLLTIQGQHPIVVTMLLEGYS